MNTATKPNDQLSSPESGTPGSCTRCQEPTKRTRDRFCSTRCQKDHQHSEYITRWLAGEVSGVKADGVLSGYVRRHLLNLADRRCSRCSWAETNPSTGLVPLEIDHADGDHQNNRPENLRVLCPNCHSLTPTYRALNKGRGRVREGATRR